MKLIYPWKIGQSSGDNEYVSFYRFDGTLFRVDGGILLDDGKTIEFHFPMEAEGSGVLCQGMGDFDWYQIAKFELGNVVTIALEGKLHRIDLKIPSLVWNDYKERSVDWCLQIFRYEDDGKELDPFFRTFSRLRLSKDGDAYIDSKMLFLDREREFLILVADRTSGEPVLKKRVKLMITSKSIESEGNTDDRSKVEMESSQLVAFSADDLYRGFVVPDLWIGSKEVDWIVATTKDGVEVFKSPK